MKPTCSLKAFSETVFAGVRSQHGHAGGEEAAIRMVLALVMVFVTGLMFLPTTAPGSGRRAAKRMLTYTGAMGGG